MTKKQVNDKTLGLISLTYPLIEKLKNGSDQEIELSEIMNELKNLISTIRGKSYLNKNDYKIYLSSKDRSKLKLIKLISELK